MEYENELIAEFMGLERSKEIWDKGEYAYTMKYSGFYCNRWTIPSQMQYHASWDWLMPVVEKIGKLYESNFPKGDEFMRRILAHEDPIEKEYVDVISTSICTPITEVYDEVIRFIKWHNSQKS